MPKERSKVALIFFGGSGIQAGDGRIVEVTRKEEIEQWLEELPELGIIADIEPTFLFGEAPSEVTPSHWVELAKTIEQHYPTVDGIVITHGIDTVIYTGSMLSFMLRNLGKPVVLVSSPLTKSMEDPADAQGLVSDYRNLGVRANLINAMQLATLHLGEVVIVHGNRVMRANQTIKSLAPSANFFETVGDGLLGKVDFGIKLFEHAKPRGKGKLKLDITIDDHVCTMRIHPASKPEQIARMIAAGCKTLLVRTYSTQPYPSSFTPYFRLAMEKGIPLVAHNLFSLHSSREREEFILVNDMTYEATLAKCIWVLGKTSSPEEFRKLLSEDTANEHIHQSL